MNALPADIQKIGVFRALQLGDMLCAVPALRALRAAYPDAKIALLGLPWAATFVTRFSAYLDRFIHFPGYDGLPEQPFDATSYDVFKTNMQKEKFDLILQMQGNGTIVNTMLADLQPKLLAGFHNQNCRMSTSLFMEYPEHGSEAIRHLSLMEHLGLPLRGHEMEFPIEENDRLSIAALMSEIGNDNYVCIHPGSRGSWRQWPPQYFAMLANYCARQGMTLVITGTKDEADITRELIRHIHYRVIDATGRTSLGGMAALLQHARLLIANCTGVSHLASALQTPSFIISMDGEPERWGPLNRSLHHVVDWTKHPPLEDVLQQAYHVIEQAAKMKRKVVAG